jgi:hypothetical protein
MNEELRGYFRRVNQELSHHDVYCAL